METRSPAPSVPRRLAAIASLLLVAAVALATLVVIADHPLAVLADLVLLGVAALAAWLALTRTGASRLIAAAVAVGAVIALVAADLLRDRPQPGSVAIRLLGLAIGVALGRWALGTTRTDLKRAETPGDDAGPARHGVLLMNLKSGGGKAERFRLVDECRSRGIEPVVLTPGDDLRQLAHDAIDRGADVIGMAGGDGSQALVATVAAERGVPMVVIPAGTRNHLALDLGLDRDDVVGALDAFGQARERAMDLAELSGPHTETRVFVNNVSLGLYAAIVRSPAYRDAKVDTTLSALPEVLGPGTEPFDLRFTAADGSRHEGAHVIQVSNNPYGRSLATMGSRPRLDTGDLGIVTLEVVGDGQAARFLAAVASGDPTRFEGLHAWAAPVFEVDSGGPVDVGLDGETMAIAPPLRFSMRPGALRVRLPHHALGYSPAAIRPGIADSGRALWRVARGRPAGIVG